MSAYSISSPIWHQGECRIINCWVQREETQCYSWEFAKDFIAKKEYGKNNTSEISILMLRKNTDC